MGYFYSNLLMLTKKWDAKNSKIKVSKNFTQSEKLCTSVELFLIDTWQMHLWANIFQDLICYFLSKHI